MPLSFHLQECSTLIFPYVPKNTPGRTVNIFSSEKITLFHLGYCSNDVANFSLLTLFSAESNGLRTGCIDLNPAAFKILVTVSLVNMRGTCYIETIQNLGKKDHVTPVP